MHRYRMWHEIEKNAIGPHPFLSHLHTPSLTLIHPPTVLLSIGEESRQRKREGKQEKVGENGLSLVKFRRGAHGHTRLPPVEASTGAHGCWGHIFKLIKIQFFFSSPTVDKLDCREIYDLRKTGLGEAGVTVIIRHL